MTLRSSNTQIMEIIEVDFPEIAFVRLINESFLHHHFPD